MHPTMRYALPLLLCICISSCFALDFTRVPLSDFYPKAICNDGSSATYFFRPGTGSGASTWVIYFEGGGYCSDVEGCKGRNASTPHFMTSRLLPAVLNDSTVSRDVNHGGIMSSNPKANPHFYNANQVYLWYCTSDCYSGLRPASNDTNGWAFNGKEVVAALMQHLLNGQKPTMKEAAHILLTGFSAGGMGTSYNADYVGAFVKAYAPKANYRAYVDSGWVLDLPPFSYNGQSSRQGMAELIQNWNLQLDESCVAFYSKTNQIWRCMFGDYNWPHLDTPTFFAQHQYDAPFVSVGPPFNNVTLEYLKVCKDVLENYQLIVPGVYNPACYSHGVEAYDDRWNVVEVNGVTPADAVWEWFNAPVGTKVRYVETCEGIGCSKGCPGF